MAEKDSASGTDRGTTPEKWDSPPDAREKGGEYPNYWVRKTRSGHTFMFDDTKENEHITLQHRSGTMIQLMPDGGFQIVSHKGRYDVTFGENRIKVTGAQDTTVDGDVSIKAKKNYNATIYGDKSDTVRGKSVETAKSKSTTIAEQHDQVVGWETKKVNNSSTEQVLGAKTLVSQYGMTVGSKGDSTAIGAQKQLGLKGVTGVAIESDGPINVKTEGGNLNIDATRIYLNSGQSQKATELTVMDQAPQPQTEQTFDVDTPVS
jgi:hypothetical protein